MRNLGLSIPASAFLLSTTAVPIAQADFSLSPVFPSAILSHSRTSLATLFDSTGKLTYAPNNLIPQSSTFQNAAWTKQASVSVTDGTIAGPSGAMTGATVSWGGASTSTGLFQSGITWNSAPNIKAIWVKAPSAGGTVEIADPTLTSGTATVTLTTSWQQLYLRETVQTTGAGVWIRKTASTPSTIYIAEATLSAVTYETAPRTADQVITTSASYYGPRIDYDITGTLKGLLIWESRKWDALWNRDFTNAVWTKTSVTASLNQTGIDGVANAASSLTATANNGTVLQNITLASSARAQSAWVKRLVGSGAISMTIDGGTTWTDVTSQISASYAWVTVPTQTLANPSVGFKFATSGDSIAVDFFGNEGGTFPSPRPIPVTSAAVTVAADVVQFTGAALTALQGSAGSAIVQVSDAPGSTANSILINATSNYLIYTQGGSFKSFDGSAIVTDGVIGTPPSRVAASWSVGGRSLVANGGAVATGAAYSAISTSLYLGSNGGSSSYNGHVASFAIYNQRLPDATLQAKSVVGASYS